MDGIQNLNPQQGAEPGPQGNQNQPRFTPPPAPQINLRTAESDVRSLERGDAMPLPEAVLPPDNAKEPLFRPETQMSGMTDVEPEHSGKKKAILWSVVGAAVLIVGGLGYFVVYPLLFPPLDAAPITETLPPPPAAPIPHQTLFIGPVEQMADVILPDLLQATIVANFSNVAAFTQAPGTMQEVVLQDSTGSQVPFKNFLNAFLPALTVETIGTWFEDDFTAFLYYDAQGTWPGMVARVKSGVNLSDARTALSALEGENIHGFYLTSPGTVIVPFKDGQVGSQPSRYMVFSSPGAAFNYAFLGDTHLLISTNYEAAKRASALLGIE